MPPKHPLPHKYILRNIGKIDKPIKVYACAIANCSHFMPVGSETLLVGKESVCHQCLKKMIITSDMITRMIVKPRCYDCRTGKKATPELKQEAKKIDSAIEMLFKLRG